MQITKRRSYKRGEGYGAFITVNGGSEQLLGYFDTALEADNAMDEEARKHLTKPESVNNGPDMFVMQTPEDATDVLASVALVKLSSPNKEIQSFLAASENPYYQQLFQGGSKRDWFFYRNASLQEAEALIKDLQRGGQSELVRDDNTLMISMYRESGRFTAKLNVTYFISGGYDEGKLKCSILVTERYEF